MAIKFICSCGKHLRARDEMAARRATCPRCGAPVGIPSLRPTSRGATLGPMTPAERIRVRQTTRSITGPSSDSGPVDFIAPPAPPPIPAGPIPISVKVSPPASSPRVVPRQGSRFWWEGRGVETHSYQCLLYPLRAWPLLLGLSAGLTILCAAAALALPGLLRDLRADRSWLVWVCATLLMIPLLIFGYGAGFLNCVLTSAMTGETRRIRWPGRDVGFALKSGATWMMCFLAGPILPAGAGLLFWIYGGDFELVDWIILAEANILALAGWFLLILAVNQNDRFYDLSPVRVVRMIQRVGHRLVALALFAGGLGLFHGWLASVAVAQTHDDLLAGFFLLLLCWTNAIYCATFLFRWVGLWFYWNRVRDKQAPLLVEQIGLAAQPVSSSRKQ